MFHPFGCPCLCRLAVDMVHECHVVSQFFREMFRHHPSGNFNRQGLQRDDAEMMHNSAASAFAGRGLSCPVAVCEHVDGLRECIDFDQALLTRDSFSSIVRCDSCPSRRSHWYMIFLAVSFTLYVISARSSHMYDSFPTAVLYTVRFLVLQLDRRLCR